MSKFSSFIVFALGIAIIAVTLVTMVRTRFFPSAAPVEERMVIPKCDLAPLPLGTREQFLAQLDKFYAAGGLDAVRDYVEKEWVPGRLLKGTVFAGEVSAGHIIDREVRRCDRQGALLLDKAPVLPRVTPDNRMGQQQVSLETWTRLDNQQPYELMLWYVADG